MPEVWKVVVGQEGRYEVSDHGRVRSLVYSQPRILRPTKHWKGYLRVSIWSGSTRKDYRVHRLVLETFVGPCPDGYEAGHLDNNKENNILTNLAWVTGSENQHHRFAHGTAIVGEKVFGAKLTADDVRSIRQLHEHGLNHPAIAKRFGVHYQTISSIILRKTWKHVA